MMKTASASDLLDATIPPATGVEIEEGCPQSLLEKRKHAETGDGSQQSQPPPTEKRNRGENEEQLLESLQPRGKQGGCKCKGGEHEGCNCKGGGEREQISFVKLSPYAQRYFATLKATLGDRVGVGNRDGPDSDDEPFGDISSMIEDHKLIWPVDDFGYCCSNPFKALDFKQDPKLYKELGVFGEKAVAFLNAKYNKTLCFEDIERVKSCPAPCKHHVVTIKARGPCEEVWEIVLRGKVGWGFLEAKAHEFLMLKYSRL